MVLPLILTSCSVFAENSVGHGVLTGDVGLVSQYIYRGGVENDDIAMQAGLEYAHQSGFSVGYWGSTLDYDATDETHAHGFEHDIYISYAQELHQNWAYKLQATSYIYQNGGTVEGEKGEQRKTTSFDVLAELAYKDLTLGAAVLLADALSGNAGDVYLSAAYSYALPQDFNLNTSMGVSAYNSHHDDSLLQTKKDFAFNEARIGVSKNIPHLGATASLDYILGGQDRLGKDLKNHVVLGLKYNF
ncbi:TorF family putative porin [Acinetobacter silvestris]|uniref:TorF family putative porin n=1 Tax=Acinetobacter silvestris TaxID=1977882 RepID=UPI003307A3F7